MDLETYAEIEAMRISNAEDKASELKRLYREVKVGILTVNEGIAILKALNGKEN